MVDNSNKRRSRRSLSSMFRLGLLLGFVLTTCTASPQAGAATKSTATEGLASASPETSATATTKVSVGTVTPTYLPLVMNASTGTPPPTGPLRVNSANPRYFTDGSGRAIYLTGSHTWSNFQDNGCSNPPPVFDYNAYLDFLVVNGHNFFRLWRWEQSRWTLETTDNNYWFNPMTPYPRTGPGTALDGLPRFDLDQFNQGYFDRMRARIVAAGNRGIYVSIMLFDGWSIVNNKGIAENNPWKGHPYNKTNNLNGINGDPDGNNSGEEIQQLAMPAVTSLQEAYVRKVIDTVNDLDNVLYEISNESDSSATAWQYHMINYLKSYEAGKPKQHPVGMTVEWPGGNNTELDNSPADWISPNGDVNNPPVADGTKVVLNDTDHLCGICGNRAWVWKSFTQGMNPIFMDGYDGAGYGVGGAGFNFNDPVWVSVRRNLGYTLAFARRMNLVKMVPRPDLATTQYCLANPSAKGGEYLIYLPSGGTVTVNLTATPGNLSVEWFNPNTGATTSGGTTTGGASRSFTAPFTGDAVLYLYQH